MKKIIAISFMSLILIPCCGMLSEYGVDPAEYSWLLESKRTDFEKALEERLGRPLSAKQSAKIERQFEKERREDLDTLKFLESQARHEV